jgi:hypothetical protein
VNENMTILITVFNKAAQQTPQRLPSPSSFKHTLHSSCASFALAPSLALFFINKAPILTIIKTNNTLNEIVIREPFICFRRVLDPQFFVNNKARLRPSTLNKLFKGWLVLAQGDDP